MRALGLMLAAMLPLAAAVDGTVTNATTGRPQAGATVTLYQFSQSGPEVVESVKSAAGGAWSIDKPFAGMGFIQTAYAGVTYNHMLRPGAPQQGIALAVFEASAQRGPEVKLTNHMMLLEPRGDRLAVRESYFFLNQGKLTWNDPANGTLRFVVSKEPMNEIEVNATAPQGMPVRRATSKGKGPGERVVDFAIKPGETRIDLAYWLPYSSPSRFQTEFLIPAEQTMIAVPDGVTLTGEGITSEGKEPTTQASIFRVDAQKLDLAMEGAGDLGDGGEAETRGPEIEQIPARSYEKRNLLLGLVLAILGCGFVLLYRGEAKK